MEKTRKSRKGIVAAVVVVVLLLAAMGAVVGLAFSDPYADTVPAAAQPDTIVPKLASSLLSGEPALLTKEEAGGLLAAQAAGLQGGGFQVLDLQCVSVADGTADFYLPVSYAGMRLGVSAHFEIGSNPEDGTIWADLQSVHLGRLPIKPEWAMRAAEQALPEIVAAEGTRLSVPSSFFDEKVLGGAVGLTVTGLQATSEGFLVTVKGNTDRLESGLGQYLQEFLTAGD